MKICHFVEWKFIPFIPEISLIKFYLKTSRQKFWSKASAFFINCNNRAANRLAFIVMNWPNWNLCYSQFVQRNALLGNCINCCNGNSLVTAIITLGSCSARQIRLKDAFRKLILAPKDISKFLLILSNY